MFSQYLRLGVSIHASGHVVVRVAVRRLHPNVRRERGLRDARKRFYRDMLNQHARARQLARRIVSDPAADSSGSRRGRRFQKDFAPAFMPHPATPPEIPAAPREEEGGGLCRDGLRLGRESPGARRGETL